MQIDWDKTIDEILGDKMACPRCSTFTDDLVAGYTHEVWGTDYAPRCQFCVRKDECDARKLVVLCRGCATELKLRSRRIDQPAMMSMLLNDCRKDLDECVEYLADYWQEDLNVPLADSHQSFEEFDAEAFSEELDSRRRLEEEYLTYHRWFREHHIRLPDPGWRAEYVEELVALGHTSLLGD